MRCCITLPIDLVTRSVGGISNFGVGSFSSDMEDSGVGEFAFDGVESEVI